jgi:predicted RNA-binding Zn-ribbon protein involved in translation (DUF1610 family)
MEAGRSEAEVEVIICVNCGVKIKLKSGKIPKHCPDCGKDPSKEE